MKILYIHQYFKTPEEGGSIRSYYLAKGLVDNGYEVEMITSYNGKRYKKETIAGIKVHYLPVYYDNSLGFWSRVSAFLKFIYATLRLIPTIQRPDICYAMSTPLTVGIIALWIKKRYGIPYYFEIGDLWPEAPIQMGFIRNPVVKYCLYWLEKTIYQRADKIIALSPGIRDSIESVVPEKDVYMIPNMADCSFFNMECKDSRFEETFQVKDKFVISYIGAAGKANHLEYLVEAAFACQQHGNLPVQFLVAASGSELERIKNMAQQKSLKNINFLPFQSKAGLKKMLNITDAIFISYADFPVLQTGSPNKYFDALAAGKLVILNTSGWLREITELNKCGFYYNPNENSFLRKLMPYVGDSNLLFSSQKNARQVAEQYYSKELQIQKLLKVFNKSHQMKVKDDSAYILTA